jgi:hypothetical protein
MRLTAILLLVLAVFVPATARADDACVTHGAIAWSRSTGKIGNSWGYSTAWQAKRAAISACGVGDCAWKVTEQNEYAALAYGTGGVAVAWNTDLGTAERDALAVCNSQGSSCGIYSWVHS